MDYFVVWLQRQESGKCPKNILDCFAERNDYNTGRELAAKAFQGQVILEIK